MRSSAKTWHPDPKQLAALAQGRLSPAECQSLRAHLDQCAPCRQELARLPGGADSLSGADTLPPAGAPKAVPPPPTTTHHSASAVPSDLTDHPRYEVLQLLGQGGMGAVYKARHKRMDRLVALKVLNAQLVGSEKAVERFHREVQAAAKLEHANIVRAYDADQARDTHFLVMEFVEGTDLARYVERKGPLPTAHACHFIRQAALGLQHAHDKGMVHRDIKPHNLMLTPQGVVKVMDFGLARLGREGTKDGGLTGENVLMGTADYIAPEQAQDAHSADIRADIYSLGCTLYHLLAGKPPFAGGTVVAKVMAHATAPMPLAELPAAVPPELRTVLAKMVAKAPAARYQTPGEVAQALAPFVKKAAGAKPLPPATPPRVPPDATGDSPSLFTLEPPAWRANEATPPANHDQGCRPGRRWRVPTLIGLGALAAILVLVFLAGGRRKPPGDAVAAKKPPLRQESPPSDKPPAVEGRVAKATTAWPGYRGSASFNPCSGLEPVPPLKQLWQADIAATQAPACVGDRIYVPSGNKIHALDCATGKTLWTTAALGQISSFPAVAPPRLYVGCGPKVYVISCDKGEVLTQTDAEATCVSLCLMDDALYVGTAAGSVLRLRPDNLEKVWQAGEGNLGEGNLVYSDGSVGYVFRWSRRRYSAIHKATGKTAWELEMQENNPWMMPVVYRETLVGHFGDRSLKALDVHSGKALWEEKVEAFGPYPLWEATYALTEDGILVWGDYGSTVCAFDLTARKMLWTRPQIAGGQGFYQTPCVTAQFVYFVGGDGIFHVLSRKTGASVWTRDSPDYKSKLSSPILHQGRLILPGGKILCFVSEAAPQPAAGEPWAPTFTRQAETYGPGTWQIKGDDVILAGAGKPEACLLVFGDPSWRDIDFACEAYFAIETTLPFRVVDRGNYYYFRSLDGYKPNLVRADKVRGDGRETYLAMGSGPISLGWHKVLLRLRGDALQGYCDDKLVVQARDPGHGRGRVGLRAKPGLSARFRNLKVTDPDGKVLWKGLPELPGAARPPDPDRGAALPRQDSNSLGMEF